MRLDWVLGDEMSSAEVATRSGRPSTPISEASLLESALHFLRGRAPNLDADCSAIPVATSASDIEGSRHGRPRLGVALAALWLFGCGGPPRPATPPMADAVVEEAAGTRIVTVPRATHGRIWLSLWIDAGTRDVDPPKRRRSRRGRPRAGIPSSAHGCSRMASS